MLHAVSVWCALRVARAVRGDVGVWTWRRWCVWCVLPVLCGMCVWCWVVMSQYVVCCGVPQCVVHDVRVVGLVGGLILCCVVCDWCVCNV